MLTKFLGGQLHDRKEGGGLHVELLPQAKEKGDEGCQSSEPREKHNVFLPFPPAVVHILYGWHIPLSEDGNIQDWHDHSFSQSHCPRSLQKESTVMSALLLGLLAFGSTALTFDFNSGLFRTSSGEAFNFEPTSFFDVWF